MRNPATLANQSPDERLAFVGLDAIALGRIRKLKPLIERELPKALDKFYERVRQTPEMRAFFRDEAHMAGAKKAQLNHWDAVGSGRLDQRFVSDVQRIGQTHARIGLEPRWYIGGYALILEHLISAVITDMWPGGVARFGGGKAPDEASATVCALLKAVLVEMDLAITTYIRGTEENERAIVNGSIGTCLVKLAAQDITCRLGDGLPDAYGALKQNFNQALDELDSAMRGVRNSISTIDAAAAEISSASEDLSRRTEGQAASLEQTTAALAEITTTIRKTADNAGHARKLVATAKVEAEKGGTVVTDAIDAMRGIESASKEINQIIGVIDEIAFQTNLLALNAGVEAARAGDAGRGFAVVASEVRALALRSADAAKQIKALIASSTAQVDRGVDLVNRTGSALKAIVSGVSDINTAVTDIAESAEEQATGVSEVNSAVGTMDQMTQQNAAMVEQSTAAARTLSELTSNLMQLIGRFQTSDQADAGDRSLHAATGVRTGPAASETRRRDGEGPRAGAPKRAVS